MTPAARGATRAAVQRDTPWRALFAAQLLIAAGLAAFHLAVVPRLAETYQRAGVSLPVATRLVVTTPASLVVAAVGALAGSLVVLAVSQRGRRLRLLGYTVGATGIAFMLAVVASVLPFTAG